MDADAYGAYGQTNDYGVGAYGGAAEGYGDRYYANNGNWHQQPPQQSRGLFGSWALPGFQQQPVAPPPPPGRGYYAPYGSNPTYGAQRPPQRGYYGGGGYD